MQTKSPSLLPILRSEALGRLLAYLFVDTRPATISEIAQRIGAAPSTVKREVDILEEAGLVTTLSSGRGRIAHANAQAPIYEELRALILKAFGPAEVLRGALADLPGVNDAYIFGSWAERYFGASGHQPRDVDVVVVGDVDPDAVYSACADAEQVLRRDVNPTVVTEDEWRSPPTPFLRKVKRGALLSLVDPQ